MCLNVWRLVHYKVKTDSLGLNGHILTLPGSNTGTWTQKFVEISFHPVPMAKIPGDKIQGHRSSEQRREQHELWGDLCTRV